MRLYQCPETMVMVVRIKIAESKNLTKAVLIEPYGREGSRTHG